jgi:signal peptidase I
MQKRRWWVRVGVALALLLVLCPSFVRAHRVAGPSDAPSYLWNDLVLVNRAAYDLNLPFTSRTLISWSTPSAGDMVLLEVPGESYVAFKRVVAIPGDRIAMRENRVMINGAPFTYETVNRAGFDWVPAENKLGAMVEMESGNGFAHYVTYTPGASPLASFDEITVPPDHYFVLGDNRDRSNDSRSFGAISRDRIHGKLVFTVSSARE